MVTWGWIGSLDMNAAGYYEIVHKSAHVPSISDKQNATQRTTTMCRSSDTLQHCRWLHIYAGFSLLQCPAALVITSPRLLLPLWHTTTHCTTVRHDVWNLLSLTYLVGVLCGQQVPAAWSYRPSNCLLLAAVPFRLLQLKFGTACQRPSSHRYHRRLSGVI